MSRIAKTPVDLVSGVEVTIAGQMVTVKGSKGTLSRTFNDAVEIVQEDKQLKTVPREGMANGWAQAGTARALLNAMVIGVSQGFEKKLLLNGVGYRAAAQGSKLNLTLGFSHPVAYEMPAGISVETPTQTEILVKGVDKQLVGQVAANIRGYRPPEPYKGKGVRLADEVVRRKEAKKK
ncbi:MAG: 50S ribosomal protein L6 [Paraglaciecola sp.]|jgi:large subunit ribosomal protein L6|nr:50S ribosomal protein L6 [Paraglaciecola sp.]NCT48299.1 50S ribosomal protein L6 [Paraglaciecola sp.]